MAGLLALPACSPPADPAPPPPPAPPGPSDPFQDTSVTSIGFQPDSALMLVAGMPRSLNVQVRPAGAHTVRFALVGLDATQAQDAFLSDDLVTTRDDGVAAVELTVLSASLHFAVRAAAGRENAVLRVDSLPANLGSLIIQPRYPNPAHRPVQHWVASVHVGETCSDLQGPPYPDGPAPVTSDDTGSVRLDRVPADSALAAVIRAEHFAGGCQNIRALNAGKDTVVDIDILDRPLQITDLKLQVSFTVDATPDINPALDELAFRAVAALTGSATDDLAALLDAMSGAVADSAGFEQARSSQNWRTVLVNGLDPSLPGTGLRTLLHGWMRTGLARLSDSGAIAAQLGAPDAQGSAALKFTSVLGLSPEQVGFPASNTATVSAETDDVLRVGTTFNWQPSPFLAAQANASAIAEDPLGRRSAADGMAAVFGCGDVARLLVDAGASPGEAYPGCDETCILNACQDAMAVLWSRVEGSALPAVPWQVSAASHAQVDGDARPKLLDGNWVGSLSLTNYGDAAIQGLVAGSSATP